MKAAGLYFLECLAVIEFVNLTFTQWVFPWLHVQDYTSLSFSTIALSLFTGIIPGIICMTSLFYGLLHCWLNCFSEMMQFADRQFYLVRYFSFIFLISKFEPKFEFKKFSELVALFQHGRILSKLEPGCSRLAVRLRLPGPGSL